MIRVPPPKEMYWLAKARSNKIIKNIGKKLPRVEDTSEKMERIEVKKKIKVFMCDWYRDTKNLPAWFKHGEEAEITWEQLQELHETGHSIMLKMAHEDGVSLLGVSNGGFGQR